MITIALIATGQPHGDMPNAAANIFTNKLTQARMNYARKVLKLRDEHIFFISIYHGLVPVSKVINPVERDIRSLTAEEKARWATGIKRDTRQMFHTLGRIVVMAGSHHRIPLVDMLKAIRGAEVTEPIVGLESGAQIEWYDRKMGYINGNGS